MGFVYNMLSLSSSPCAFDSKQRVKVGGWCLLSKVGDERKKENLRGITPGNLWELARMY